MDTSKHIFQLHGMNAAEAPVLRKKLRRKEMVTFFEKLAPTVIGIEACSASNHWARLLQSFGHTVKLIAPQLVKPYVKRGKNDAADAEALCQAMSRPTMRFVPVKTAEQQAALMLVGVRDRLIRNRTQLSNTIRSHAGEFGLIAAKGRAHLDPLLERLQADQSLPILARLWPSGSVAERIGNAFLERWVEFCRLAWMAGHGKTLFLPEMSPHSGECVAEGGAAFVIPGCAHNGPACLRAELCGEQGHEGE
jgi:hypothetical protein